MLFNERMDPAEVQALNDEITPLKAESASAEAKEKRWNLTQRVNLPGHAYISLSYTSSNIAFFS